MMHFFTLWHLLTRLHNLYSKSNRFRKQWKDSWVGRAFVPNSNTGIFDSCYYPSAYEQKQPTGMKPSSPVTPPCSTPVSPLHHGSPTTAPTPKPDRTYTHIPPSQALPDNAYTMDHRYCSLQPLTFTSHLHLVILAGSCTKDRLQ